MITRNGDSRRDEIVRVALALLDEEGLEAVSLRAVARRLGVRLNTVSWHVKTKARLRELMADAIFAGISLDGLPDDWRDRTTELAHRFRRALLAHRDGAFVVAGTFVAEPATLRAAEALVAALLDGGLEPRDAGWTCWTILYFTLGLTQEEQGATGAVAGLLESAVTPDSHPALARVLPHLVDNEFTRRFEFGLDRILDAAARG
ncbi:TetR/AcrR family transcriptional regulator C-terminal domain-containing protein [Amycolatopsis methanolica]|uniref:Tetracyclin repressor domain-containing protein n=1 Tax=Amycolatopsis methanolica 239 TaxID=1068978 RepID=A0A076MXA9_AMYME|nr:TetR/AcrR family transcriptional regulator C-terminal domain-containing protein [Amycolatopsis methanolica]AIJ25363.1 Tetracyclin repressor domain-containing protein [Amycolatopsis methanolica 239]